MYSAIYTSLWTLISFLFSSIFGFIGRALPWIAGFFGSTVTQIALSFGWGVTTFSGFNILTSYLLDFAASGMAGVPAAVPAAGRGRRLSGGQPRGAGGAGRGRQGLELPGLT